MAVPTSPFWPVGLLLDRFRELGCEVRVAEAEIEAPDGDTYSLRYVLNPRNGRFVPLVDLSDVDRVPERIVALWERRLGLRISRPGQDH